MNEFRTYLLSLALAVASGASAVLGFKEVGLFLAVASLANTFVAIGTR